MQHSQHQKRYRDDFCVLTHLLDDLLSHRLHEVVLSGIHGAGKHEVLPNLKLRFNAVSSHLFKSMPMIHVAVGTNHDVPQ